MLKNPHASGTTSWLCPLRGMFFYGWIPAFAGMTHFFLMDCFALSLVLLLVLQALMV
jgi:hypothetical protein